MTPFITGMDGKLYPRGPLTPSDRDYVIGRVHYLSHDLGLSVREIREYLLYNHALRRSVGSVAAYLREPCVKCSGGRDATPEQSGGAR